MLAGCWSLEGSLCGHFQVLGPAIRNWTGGMRIVVETRQLTNKESLWGKGRARQLGKKVRLSMVKTTQGTGTFRLQYSGVLGHFQSVHFPAHALSALAAGVFSISANWLLSYANINSSLSTLLFCHSFRFIYLLCSLR